MKKYIAYFTSLLICAVALGGTSLYGAAEHAQNQKNYEQLKANIQRLKKSDREHVEKLEDSRGMRAICRGRWDYLELIEKELRTYFAFLGEVRGVDKPNERVEEKPAKQRVNKQEAANILGAKLQLVLSREQYHRSKLKEIARETEEQQAEIAKLNKDIKDIKNEQRVSWWSRLLEWFKYKQTGPINEDVQTALRNNIDRLYADRAMELAGLRTCLSQFNKLTKQIKADRSSIKEFVQLEVQSVQEYKNKYNNLHGVDAKLQTSLREFDYLIQAIEALSSKALERIKLEQIKKKLARQG